MIFFRVSGEPVVADESDSGTGDDDKGEMEMYKTVGRINATHGLKGEVKVISSTDFPEIRFGKVLKFLIVDISSFQIVCLKMLDYKVTLFRVCFIC